MTEPLTLDDHIRRNIIEHFRCTRKTGLFTKRRLTAAWVKIRDDHINCAPGVDGPWYYFGKIAYRKNRVSLKFKTVKHIVYGSSIWGHTASSHYFNLAEPELFDQMEELVNIAATNALAAYQCQLTRNWRNLTRDRQKAAVLGRQLIRDKEADRKEAWLR